MTIFLGNSPITVNKIGTLLNELFEINKYYRNLIEQRGINLRDFTLKEFEKLPFLIKDDIRTNETNYYSKTNEEALFEYTTGTTGKPLKCFKTRTERIISSLAVWEDRRSWDPEVNLDNYISMYGDKYGDTFNFNLGNMLQCFEKISRDSPRWLSAPVTAVKQYAKLIENKYIKYSPSQIKFIELVGEYVDPEDRLYVEHVFGCKSIIHYGLRETWSVAYECPHGNLHVRNELFYIEGITSNLNHENSILSEIILTSLYNKLMPIIRYTTGDLGFVECIKCKCGKSGQIIKLIGGRKAGLIKGASEYLGDIFFKRVVRDLYDNGYDCIESFKVEQVSINLFNIDMVIKETFNDEAKAMFLKLINNRLGRQVSIHFNYVSELVLVKNGKSQLFKCLC